MTNCNNYCQIVKIKKRIFMSEYNIQELANKVNSLLKKEENLLLSIKDSRISVEITERRIRDYMSKGLLEKPLQDGGKKWFNDQHVEQLKAIRTLQLQGISESVIKDGLSKSLESYTSTEIMKKNDALDFLNSLSSQSASSLNTHFNAPVYAATTSQLQGPLSEVIESGRQLTNTQSMISENKYKISSVSNSRKSKVFEDFDILNKDMMHMRFSSEIDQATREEILIYLENKLQNLTNQKRKGD